MTSIVGFVAAILLFVQTPSLPPEVQRQVDMALADRPLDSAVRVTLTFDAATPVKDVLVAIGKATGLIVRFDQAVPEQEKPFAGQLSGLSIDAALTRVVTANAMAFKVVGPKSVFIYSDTAANRQRFAESVRTFVLAKAEPGMLARQILQMMMTSLPDGLAPIVIPVREPSLLVVRATGDKMGAIAAMIASADKH